MTEWLKLFFPDKYLGIAILAASIIVYIWKRKPKPGKRKTGLIRLLEKLRRPWMDSSLRFLANVRKFIVSVTAGKPTQIFLVILVALSMMGILHWWDKPLPLPIIPPEFTGIVIAQMAGSTNSSLQRNLAGALNKISSDGQHSNCPVTVRFVDETIDERNGMEAASEAARELGRRLNASIVVWGSQISDKAFYLRISLVETNLGIEQNVGFSGPAGEQQLADQILTENGFPPRDSIIEPYWLATFLSGLSCFSKQDFDEAFGSFKEACDLGTTNAIENADANLFAGLCEMHIAGSGSNSVSQWESAIGFFHDSAAAFSLAKLQGGEAIANNNEGYCHYVLAQLGKSKADLDAAITSYESAADIYSSSGSNWLIGLGVSKNNLGLALRMRAAWGENGNSLADYEQARLAHDDARRAFIKANIPSGVADSVNGIALSLIGLANSTTGAATANYLWEGVRCETNSINSLTNIDNPQVYAQANDTLGTLFWTIAWHLDRTNALKLLFKARDSSEIACSIYLTNGSSQNLATALNNRAGVFHEIGFRLGGDAGKTNLTEASAEYDSVINIYHTNGLLRDEANAVCSSAINLRDLATVSEPQKAMECLNAAELRFTSVISQFKIDDNFGLWCSAKLGIAAVYEQKAELTNQMGVRILMLQSAEMTATNVVSMMAARNYPESASVEEILGSLYLSRASATVGSESQAYRAKARRAFNKGLALVSPKYDPRLFRRLKEKLEDTTKPFPVNSNRIGW